MNDYAIALDNNLVEISGYCEKPECCGREFTVRIEPNPDWEKPHPQVLTCPLCMSEIRSSTISALTRSELSQVALAKAALTIAEARVSRREQARHPGLPVALDMGEIADEVKSLLTDVSSID
jgi:hypothetical protein